MKRLIFLLTMVISFTGCTFKDDPTKSVFGEWLWLLVVIPTGAALWNLYMSFKKARSGAERQLPKGGYGPAKDLKFWEISNFKYAVVFAIAAILIFIAIVWER